MVSGVIYIIPKNFGVGVYRNGSDIETRES